MSEENRQIEEKLKIILGEDAYVNGGMQVSDSVSKMAKAINYLSLQLWSINRFVDDGMNADCKRCVKDILRQVNNILKK